MSDTRFAIIPAVAFDHLEAQQIALLAALALFQDKSGKCWPKYTTLASMLSKSKAWVGEHIGKLEEAGFLRIERTTGGKSIFYITYDTHQPAEHTPQPAEGTPQPAEHITVPMNSTNKQNSNRGAGKPKYDSDGFSNMVDEVDEDAFGIWYQSYPRRIGKAQARKSYLKALDKTDAASLLRASESYAVERSGEDDKYTKHPATWLNQECWDDEGPILKEYICEGTGDRIMLDPEEAKGYGPAIREVGG